MTADDSRTEVSYYMIHPALKPKLDEWLVARGFRVDLLPSDLAGTDRLPTYLVSPGGRLLNDPNDDQEE